MGGLQSMWGGQLSGKRAALNDALATQRQQGYLQNLETQAEHNRLQRESTDAHRKVQRDHYEAQDTLNRNKFREEQRETARLEGMQDLIGFIFEGPEKGRVPETFNQQGQLRYKSYRRNQDGSVVLTRPDGQEATLPSDIVRDLYRERYGLSQVSRSDSTSKKTDYFVLGAGLQDFGRWYNIEPKSQRNPDGVSTDQMRGLRYAAERGIDYETAATKLGIRERKHADLETAKTKMRTAADAVQSFGGKKRIYTERTMKKQAAAIYRFKAAKARVEELQAKYGVDEDMSQKRFGEEKQPVSARGGLQAQEQQPPRVMINPKYDTNGNGKIDDGDRIYELAKKAVEALKDSNKAPKVRERFTEKQLAEFNAIVTQVEKKLNDHHAARVSAKP